MSLNDALLGAAATAANFVENAASKYAAAREAVRIAEEDAKAALSGDPADITKSPFRIAYPLLAADPTYAYLDNAATAQRPSMVLKAQKEFYTTMNANPLRGLYRHSHMATSAIEDARKHVARFLGVEAASERDAGNQIVFLRNTSEALNLLAHSLPEVVGLEPGDQICISIMEHHSNLIPWQQACKKYGAELVYMRPNEEGVLESATIQACIGPNTKIVSVVHISNVLGIPNPIAEIAQRAHEVGAVMVVDGAQSAPHIPIDVEELGCDFFAMSAHKMGGPMGVGVLWGRPEFLDQMEPMLTGGEMIDSVTEEDAVWAQVPQKFEAGTQDAAGIYAFDAAISYLESIGFETIEERERKLSAYLVQKLKELSFIEIVGSANPDAHLGVVSFNVKGIHPHDVASLLDEENVAIRAGHHCAQPLLTWMGISSCCRASIAFYNSTHDIDRLAEALEGVWGMFHAH
ncbi:MAG: SufS family cysteine desulfurase [Coriobacteriales bacterium]|nr:SufS family cysteine desulfurase [Coriobacteriales bacterium]